MDQPISPTEEIFTPRCRLRHPDESDLVHIWSATRVAGFNDGMPWDPPKHIDDLTAPLERARADWRAGVHFTWTVEARSTREFLGRISIRREEGAAVWSIGFWIHPQHQGRGYATEVAAALVDFGFSRLDAECITAAHAAWNQASARVLERIGMIFVRSNPRGFVKRGAWVEEREYEIRRRHNTA